MNKINTQLENSMNSAIEFLAIALNATGHNSKPVLLHSIRVGFYLYKKGYNQDIVLGGLLHDILEDTETSINDLNDKFGIRVTKIVAANSFNTSIGDKTEQFQDMFNRCKEYGKEALIIKAADIMDNSNYIQFVNDKKTINWLLFKMKSFINISREEIEKEDVWKE
ncbi:HD domain-containing protein [Haloimpatiens sp. FM7330]|uniref:HD domain-containing protein n=1 Tax=Haloimpatiens sp. FM7330 TaxID=3298610 RepID=UPI0036358483